ncbi:MAG: endonuclease/exonuclease/phosphatase family protein [Deltaproteobacteria bacterium]|nr:endonuclease/exonuclease/phosphatase family protein [Deltaproteobacteria bacterium]
MSITIPAANATEKIFKLLTLNLLFSEPSTSPSSGGVGRFDSIAKFILEENIDCVLCQEVVGGKLAKELGLIEMLNGALELKSKLGDDYKLRYRLANGIPFVLSVGNAILCKRPIDIKWTVGWTLPFAYEITFKKIDIKLRRKIMGCLLDVPDFWRLLLFNVHLCAACPTDQRQAQINKALKFIKTVQWFVRLFYGNVPCVFGGDFNIPDVPKASPDAAADEYNLITGAGFIDAYAETNGCVFQTDCCIPDASPLTVEPGCTFAVDDNHFENDPLKTTRIDYFFLQEFTADAAYVVFNGERGPFVSDHSGLVVEMSPWD